MSAAGDWRVARVLALRELAQTMGREALEQLDGSERAALELAAADVARVSLVLERVFQVDPQDDRRPLPRLCMGCSHAPHDPGECFDVAKHPINGWSRCLCAVLLALVLPLAACIGEPFTSAGDDALATPTADAGDARGAQPAGEDAAVQLAAGDAAAGDALAELLDAGELQEDAADARSTPRPDAASPPGDDASAPAADAGGTHHACTSGPSSCPACPAQQSPCCTTANLCGCALLGAVCR